MGRSTRRDFFKVTGAASAVGLAGAAGLVPGWAYADPLPGHAKIKAEPRPWSQTVGSIGIVGNQRRFDINDLTDLGVKHYRFYQGISVYQPVDASGEYGTPTIDAIKADPNVINWAAWDAAMATPHSEQFQSIVPWIGQMNAHGIEPMMCMNCRGADWATPIDPLDSDADRAEWWAHIFGAAYWYNVRNDYRVDRWQVLNEVNNYHQSLWEGTPSQYAELVRLTHDAIDHVYRTYLPGREYHIHAPNTSVPSTPFVATTLAEAGDAFDTLTYHAYAPNVSDGIRTMHRKAAAAGYPDRGVWLSEFNMKLLSRDPELNLKVSTGVNNIENLMRFCRPGDDHLVGATLMTLYQNPNNMKPRLIDVDGTRNPPYFSYRMANRALQGGREAFRTTTTSNDLDAITTRDDDGAVWLLVTNHSKTTGYRIGADLSRFGVRGRGTQWAYGEGRPDVIIGRPVVHRGGVDLQLPANSATLVGFGLT